MTWVALVGSESQENLPLRCLAGSLARAGYASGILPLKSALAAILEAPQRPAVVGLSLDTRPQAQLALSAALALRQHGYAGHIAAIGRIATAMGPELLRDFASLDSILRQDPEPGFVALVSSLARGLPLRDIPGLVCRGSCQLAQTELSCPERTAPPTICFDRASASLIGSRGHPGAVAAEMVEMQRTSGIEIFVFRDDSFFPSSKRKNRERLHALADALEQRGIGRFATVVSARSTDVDRELFHVLRDRLQAIRVDLDVASDARRWSRPRGNQRAIDIMRELDLYSCLSVLAFDPNTTLGSLGTNLEFMRQTCDFPFHVARAPLCAPDIERVFSLAEAVFDKRDRLVSRIMATRFDMEVCRHFHPGWHERSWRAEGIALTRALGEDSVHALRCIVDHVERSAASADDAPLVGELARGMREVEAQIGAALAELAARVAGASGRSRSAAFVGSRAALEHRTY